MDKQIGVVTSVEKGDNGPEIRVDNPIVEILSLEAAIKEQPGEREKLTQLYNSCYVGDIVEYESAYSVWHRLSRNITADTGIVTSRVIESNPISQLPILQDTGIFQHHIVLLNNPRWGDFVMTPINTLPNKDKIQIEYNLAEQQIKYLPALIRFCNLKPDDCIGVSRHLSKDPIAHYANESLNKYFYVVEKWSR